MKYVTTGVCAREINFDIVDSKIRNVSFISGCGGNLLGIAKLVDGMNVDEAIFKLEGILCGSKETSCPDQLARALKKYKAES